jgi:hypothetical protein
MLTVILGSLLVLSGIAGVAVGIASAGFVASLVLASLPRAVPIFVVGALDLLGGVELRALRRRAVVVLSIGVAARLVFTALQPWGWWSSGQSVLVLTALFHAIWLRRTGALSAGPNNSSKPTPLRGAA